MFKDNALLAQLKNNIQENLPKLEGRIKATDKSYGFLETDKGKSHFIAPPMMKNVMHGDIVSALLRTEKDKTQAEPTSLVTAALTQFVGRVKQQNNKLYVVVDNAPQIKPIRAKGISGQQVNDNDWVVATLVRHPLQKQPDNSAANSNNGNAGFYAEIDRLVATNDDSNAPWLVTLAKYNAGGAKLPLTSPDEPSPTAEPVQWHIDDQGIERINLLDQLFFTIDGEKTQDMDDAISISVLDNGNWQLTIAIADPSAYVTPDSEFDKIAQQRGYTHYLPGRNILMLPASLSHDICSLRENQQRPAMLCKMEIASNGALTDNVEFCAGWIKSSHRLNYHQVSAFIEQKSQDWQPTPELAQALETLSEMAFARAVWRAKNSQLFDERPDYRFELDHNNRITKVRVEYNGVANQMVEESMLLANISGAKLLRQHLGNGIFNTHPGIDPDKAQKAALLLKEHGYIYSKEHLLTVIGYCQLQRELTSRNAQELSGRLRKLQNYGNISPEPQPHFGLGVAQYATWTSPIRKYGDLLNHRLIKSIIFSGYQAAHVTAADAQLLKSQRDNQRYVERDIGNWLYVDYLSGAVESKQRFDAVIFNINRAGFMARLIDNGAVVFVPAASIHKERKACKCDTEAGQIKINDEVRFSLNDKVSLIIIQANQERRNLVAKLADSL